VKPRLPENERGLCPLYEAAWMRASVARAHLVERALARQGLAADGILQARRVDTRDTLLAYAMARPKAWHALPAAPGRLPEPPPWKKVFTDLCRFKRLGRQLQLFGWTQAHRVLLCGGALVEWWAPGLVEMCGCSAEGCACGVQPCSRLGAAGSRLSVWRVLALGGPRP
jgi:hypothetical protein